MWCQSRREDKNLLWFSIQIYSHYWVSFEFLQTIKMFYVPPEENAPFCNPICITIFFDVRKNIIHRGFEYKMSSFLIPIVAWTVGNLIQMIFKAYPRVIIISFVKPPAYLPILWPSLRSLCVNLMHLLLVLYGKLAILLYWLHIEVWRLISSFRKQ